MPIPEISLSAICPADVPVKLLVPEFEHGGVTTIELEAISRITAHFAPKMIFEFGTFNGRTTLNMAANSPESATVCTLDLPLESSSFSCRLTLDPKDAKYISQRTFGKYFQGSEYSRKIVQLFGDSARFDFSPWTGKFDLVFVDGAHSFEYVINDSRHALSLLRSAEGIILWHDYKTKWEGVTDALDHLFEKAGDYSGLCHIQETSLVIRKGVDFQR